jgi:hypothetical protein
MTTWFHSTIIATSLAACAAVGLASASIYSDTKTDVSAKTDRLSIIADTAYHTVETRSDGISVLTRIPALPTN